MIKILDMANPKACTRAHGTYREGHVLLGGGCAPVAVHRAALPAAQFKIYVLLKILLELTNEHRTTAEGSIAQQESI